MPVRFKVFDSHLHIIDDRFPLVPGSGYVPPTFRCEDYLKRTETYTLCGGAVVSGSFQGFDQSYLSDALDTLGPAFVGVTQLPADVPDARILELDRLGVRAVRFNLHRGGSESLPYLPAMAHRVYDLAGWHVELYVDGARLDELYEMLIRLPAVSIDHMGLRRAGLKTLTRLAERGVRVKASGFGRVDFNVANALGQLYSANPSALMFGTDLPSTRAPAAYRDEDLELVIETLGADAARNVLSANALAFYRLEEGG